jgi:uncharacterized membrane protein
MLASLRWLHITAGLVVIVSGAFALFSTKGSPLHRGAGRVFFFAMATLTGTGLIAATFVHPNRGNVVASMVTFYLVATAYLTVKRDVVAARGWYVALTLLGFFAGLRALALGVMAARAGQLDQFPPAAFFMFALIALAAASLDVRLLVAGQIKGAQRLVRHLWRMGMAYWIATASLFLGQAKFFPAPMRASGVLFVPVLLVAGTTLYYLVRTLRGRKPARSTVKAS